MKQQMKLNVSGISRAWTEIEQADRIILMLDSSDPDSQNIEKVRSEFLSKLPNNMPVTIVRNKVDLSGEAVGLKEEMEQRSFVYPPKHIRV